MLIMCELENAIRICLTPRLFDLLENESNKLLFLSKFITDAVIDYCIKNRQIKMSDAKKLMERKQKMIRHLFIDVYSNLEDMNLMHELRYLEFNNLFIQPITSGVLPSTLRHLTFGFDFNQPINPCVLPLSLSHLTFGTCFNQPINPCVLPPTLSHLTFDYGFDQPITSRRITTSTELSHIWS